MIPLLILITACQDRSGQQQPDTPPVKIDSIAVSDLETIISTESGLLAQPSEMVSVDTQHFAVYDGGLDRVIVFNSSGVKQYEFGRIGGGPGEWDAMSGAADLNYQDNRFFLTNRGKYMFDLYDRSGNHLSSVSFPQYMNYRDKTLLPNHQLLVTTKGHENALAVILDLNENGKIVQKIGSPEAVPAPGVRNFEEERQTYANGEIPDQVLNEALATKNEGGFFLVMNGLGELRRYGNDGTLQMRQPLPESIKRSIFNFVVMQNREMARLHTSFQLKYVQDFLLKDGLIYLFLTKLHPEMDEFNSQILAYNYEGRLVRRLVFLDPDKESVLYDFIISPDDKLYFIDIMNARVLRTDL